MKDKVLVSCGWPEYHPFDALEFKDYALTTAGENLHEDSVLLLHGGSDISPSIYGKGRSWYTGADEKLSIRDANEVAAVKRAAELGIPIIGICRGAQLLCAMAGGHLIQHVNNHSGSHMVTTKDGKTFKVNSIHHQMMFPFDIDHEMIGWTSSQLSNVHIDVMDNEDVDIQVPVEPEIVYFPKLKGLGIQWHPEMMSANTEANQFVLETIRNHYA